LCCGFQYGGGLDAGGIEVMMRIHGVKEEDRPVMFELIMSYLIAFRGAKNDSSGSMSGSSTGRKTIGR